jgi:uncharacterized membrane protein
MIPLIVLVALFLVFLFAGSLGVVIHWTWVTSLRLALAVMFLLTASAHWGFRRPDLLRMVPSQFPNPELLVTLTGIAEIAGAVGLMIPRLVPWAAGGLALLLLAVFPANVHAANAALTIGGRPVPGVLPRALIQVVFLAAVLATGYTPR